MRQDQMLGSIPAAYITTCQIYDNNGQIIQFKQSNITGGIDVTSTQYSWAGWPLVTVQKQEEKKGGSASQTQTTVVVTKMTYDDLGRVVKTEMKQSNSKVAQGAMSGYATISEVSYDALGQVKTKKIGKRRNKGTGAASDHITTPLESQDYEYNIRGWLLGVNRAYVKQKSTTDSLNTATTTGVISGEMFTESTADLQVVTFPSSNYFGFDLGYDQKNNDRINNIPYDSARYDGNITGMTWKGANDRKIRKYDFGYDPVSRLTKAKFGQLVGSTFSTTPVNYNVDNLTYDNNGNILTMNQYGLKATGTSSIIDQLSYHYMAQSNKLLNVIDQANDANSTLGDFKYDPNITKTANTVDYTYDGNGNMISDQNKKITNIVYNILNLPSQITISSKGIIRYYYDATGSKLQKRTLDNTISPSRTTVTNYISGAVYQNDTLQFFGTPEGRVRANEDSTGWLYDYFLKDHLGNTRMMITDDYNVASPILEASSYYPFGLQQKGIGLTQAGSLHNFKNTFQKQELNEDLGVILYEFKYRMDDPQIGRFWQIDPLADKYEYNSTYAFSEDKVINGVELEGLERTPAPYNAWDVSKSVGRIQFTPKSQAMGSKVAKHFGLLVVGVVTDNPELVGPIVVDEVTGLRILISAASESTAAITPGTKTGEVPSKAQLLNAKGDYSDLKEPKNVKSGGKTTPAQRKRILDENKKRNNGKLVSDGDGRPLINLYQIKKEKVQI